MSMIPNSYVNPNVCHVKVSKLRSFNASQLKGIDKTIVIQENDRPLAVLLKYEDFMAMQKQLLASLEQAILSDKSTVEGVLVGRNDVKSGNTRGLEEVRDSLRKVREKA